MFITTFTVSGRGHFPLDMLRYDHAFPMRGEDVSAIEDDDITDSAGVRAPRYVNLGTYHAVKGNPGITFERWASFGWSVVQVGMLAPSTSRVNS